MSNEQGTIVLTGNMDGCHLGHQEMLRVLCAEAQKRNLIPLVLTFDPHPVHFFKEAKSLKLLTTLEEKKAILEEYGVTVKVVEFTHELSQMSSKEYVTEVLIKQFHAQCWVTGFNHQFGKASSRGSEHDLNYFLDKIGLERVVVNEVTTPANSISSSNIRSLIQKGDVENANVLLGRPYELAGVVVHGDKIGAQLGFRTANIALASEHKLVPKAGVYGGICLINGEKRVAAINIGVRPTFQGIEQRIEAHLLDYSGDIYSQKAVLQLHLHIRDELSFESTEGLKSQIAVDIKKIRAYFN